MLDVHEQSADKPSAFFELSGSGVVEDTIVVRIDGVTATLGWSYDAKLNAVVFDPEYFPPTGSTIEIEYVVAGPC